MSTTAPLSVAYFNRFAPGKLPEYLGFHVVRVARAEVEIEFEVCGHHLAPNGFLHGGAVVALADTCAGYGTLASLPEGAGTFTTIELKTNFFGTVREGKVRGLAQAEHLGRSTQVWSTEVVADQSGKRLALFRCTQMLMYPE